MTFSSAPSGKYFFTASSSFDGSTTSRKYDSSRIIPAAPTTFESSVTGLMMMRLSRS